MAQLETSGTLFLAVLLIACACATVMGVYIAAVGSAVVTMSLGIGLFIDWKARAVRDYGSLWGWFLDLFS
tara:strand:- start:108 stop:317 length:210 start_codon:yes stop_codon:yes gene_type:complete